MDRTSNRRAFVFPAEPSRFDIMSDGRPNPEEALLLKEEGELDSDSDAVDRDSVGILEELLQKLDAQDQDIAHLYLMEGKTQADIGRVMGLTQAAISYRISRIMRELGYWANRPPFDREAFLRDTEGMFRASYFGSMLADFVVTTSVGASSMLWSGMNQGAASYVFHRARKQLNTMAAEHGEPFTGYAVAVHYAYQNLHCAYRLRYAGGRHPFAGTSSSQARAMKGYDVITTYKGDMPRG